MKYPLNIVILVMVISFLLINFPVLGVVDASGNWGAVPGIYIYSYLVWIALIAIYYLLFRKTRN